MNDPWKVRVEALIQRAYHGLSRYQQEEARKLFPATEWPEPIVKPKKDRKEYMKNLMRRLRAEGRAK